MTTGAKALTYAEQTLGVHKVYEELERLTRELSEARQEVIAAKKDKHAAEVDYTDAEYSFIADTRSQMSELSQTAFDKAIKAAINKEPNLRAMRGKLADLSHAIDLYEVRVANLRTEVDIRVARLNELGGYFAYLASVKNAETARLPKHDDWPSASAVAAATTPATPTPPAN